MTSSVSQRWQGPTNTALHVGRFAAYPIREAALSAGSGSVKRMASFLELCLDTDQPDSQIASFWAAVSGGSVKPGTTRPADVLGATEQQSIAICPVPETKSVKNRMHLDVYTLAVEDLVRLGAEVVLPAEESGFGWTTMLDPEGNEFCAFVRDELPDYRVHGLGIDCVDPKAQAAWWGAALGAELIDNTSYGEGWWTLEHATDDPVLTWDFAPVPEPKTVKNRLHGDFVGTVEEFLDRGATRLDDQLRWTVLADPEGNEFCVFPAAD